jgi:hypothetical protein
MRLQQQEHYCQYTTSLTATNLTATTTYRAVLKSGTCAAINSSTATVTVSAPVAQTVSGTNTVCIGYNYILVTSGELGLVLRQL